MAHYDGLGAHDVVEALAALEREAGCPSDLGWVSDAMLEPTFRLVTAARADRLRGYAAATRRGPRVELQRLVAVTDPDLDETQVSALLVDAVLRVAGRPPYRELDTVRESDALSMLHRLGWREVEPDSGLVPPQTGSELIVPPGPGRGSGPPETGGRLVPPQTGGAAIWVTLSKRPADRW